VQVGLVILPTDRWTQARQQWEWADGAGFTTAWTYDHVRWGGMPDGPWHAALPVLAAAAEVTHQVRIGTLVATPNFRHPVPLARDALALDDISGGRLDLGLGPGSGGLDATALGQVPWSNTERLDRFEQFLEVLEPIVHGSANHHTTVTTAHYAADAAPSTPGAVQQPLPLSIAAGGARGLGLAVRYGAQWVTIGPTAAGPRTPDRVLTAVTGQCQALELACARAGRDLATLGKVLLWTPTETVFESAQHFTDLFGPYEALGFTQVVIHHPEQTGPYRGSIRVFEEIASRYAAT
jgi:alkanesulfonate monooxygenase SsuD/methylene tetrahydromethanopterin reductase-like flavin-dependent oxidoreductase (luciferase family)